MKLYTFECEILKITFDIYIFFSASSVRRNFMNLYMKVKENTLFHC